MNDNLLFWNVDTQIDFIEPDGKLYVHGAENLKPILSLITKLAARHHIRVVNTCDYHLINSAELSSNPDFINSFPEHCMAGSDGSAFIPETDPKLPVVVDWDQELAILPELVNSEKYRNIVIRKDNFDVFEGNPYTKSILDILHPDRVYVYGVTTNVCVDKAVCGLIENGEEVIVIRDAIKELPGIPLPFENWEKIGVKLIDFEDLCKIFD